ncbi:hypothetical protein BXZ70DRAFT_431326 [Cristinia sonorae]|uniref:Uncharacterized protein n=1 Tax=Cristinia sonorae TaxID=1940300 RepID=A0A8K0UWL9_9AGAR|nr:hypothetical protein BXZ70DRAFT_431326 [Cristinia sonorae]
MQQMVFGSITVSSLYHLSLCISPKKKNGRLPTDVQASVDPVPRTAVNRTKPSFTAFQAMMFIFGFLWAGVNIVVAWNYARWVSRGAFWNGTEWGTPTGPRKAFKWLFNLFIAFPFFLLLIILPPFGGWILVPIAQNWAWNHRCDTYPMYALLDARSFKDPADTPDVVRFYQTSTNQLLFTYDVNDGTDTNLFMFSLRQFDTPQSLIPVNQYPTLQHIQYDFLDTTLSGDCTVSTFAGSFNTTNSPCMTGTYNPNEWLSFNITSSVPLNGTDPSTPVPSSNTLLRTVDKEWSLSDLIAPALILRTVDPLTDQLTDQTVLRTAVTKRGDCSLLKVCLAGMTHSGSLVGAEVLAPLGFIMFREVDHARVCTLPAENF